MKNVHAVFFLLSGWCTVGLAQNGGGPSALYDEVTQTHLPVGRVSGLSMDAATTDLDADGDLDIVIVHEFGNNILLLNNGTGRFESGSRQLPSRIRDSEDVGIADLDGDGDLDLVIVSEDDRINEMNLNKGDGSFTLEEWTFPGGGHV